MNKSLIVKLIPALVLGLSLVSCNRGKVVNDIKADILFSLEYGNFDDQINLFDITSLMKINTHLAMKDGFFYISNGESKKLLEMNSYGDLLSLYYNPDFNKHPLSAQNQNEGTSTLKSIAYDFEEISLITVDDKKCLYVVDKLPVERQEQDSDSNEVLNNVILKFDSDGNFIHYIGQQGPGGTPFPYLMNLYTTDNNELVVICKTLSGLESFWFNESGFLKYRVPFNKKTVPNPHYSENVETWAEIKNAVPDAHNEVLYVMVNYYRAYIDEASKMQSGIDFVETMVYPLSISSSAYEKPIVIPPYTQEISEGFSKITYDIPYDFLGATDSGWFYFIISTEEGYSVQMVQENGQRILKRNIPMDHSRHLYFDFALSDKGILSGLFAEKDKVRIMWWRTDSLLDAVIKQ